MKSILNLLILAILLLSGLFACNKGNESYDPELMEIDSLLNVNPERAYELISSIDTNKIESRNNRQFYNLLFAEARYKNYYDDTIDAGISSAARYFQKSGDKRKAARALFQDGQIKMNQENYGGALISMHEALENLDSVQDPFIYARINSEISRIYFKLHASPLAIEHELKAYNNYLKCDSLIFIMETEDALAQALNNAGLTKEGKEIALKLLKRAEKVSDTLMIQKALIDLSLSSLWEKDDEEAIKNYEMAYRLDSIKFPEQDRELFLNALIRMNDSTGNFDSYINKLVRQNGELKSYDYYEYSGIHDIAFKKLKEEFKSLNKTYDKILKDRSLKQVNDYKNTIIQKEKDELRLKILTIWIILLSSLVLILVVLVIFLLIINKKNSRIRDLSKSILLLTLEGEKVKKELEKEIIKNESEEETGFYSPRLISFFKEIGTVYAQIYRKDNTEAERRSLIKNFEKEFNLLRKDENFIRDLEKWINSKNNNILDKIYTYLCRVSFDQRILITLLYFGMNTEIICLFLGIDPNAYYGRKNRLIRNLSKSDSKEIKLFIEKLK